MGGVPGIEALPPFYPELQKLHLAARYLNCSVLDLFPPAVAAQLRGNVALREMAFVAAAAEREAAAD
jgi:hypothetical protein